MTVRAGPGVQFDADLDRACPWRVVRWAAGRATGHGGSGWNADRWRLSMSLAGATPCLLSGSKPRIEAGRRGLLPDEGTAGPE